MTSRPQTFIENAMKSFGTTALVVRAADAVGQAAPRRREAPRIARVSSDAETIIHPESARFFEVPIHGPLPEELNDIP